MKQILKNVQAYPENYPVVYSNTGNDILIHEFHPDGSIYNPDAGDGWGYGEVWYEGYHWKFKVKSSITITLDSMYPLEDWGTTSKYGNAGDVWYSKGYDYVPSDWEAWKTKMGPVTHFWNGDQEVVIPEGYRLPDMWELYRIASSSSQIRGMYFMSMSQQGGGFYYSMSFRYRSTGSIEVWYIKAVNDIPDPNGLLLIEENP